jgi:hypothetical protein
VNAPVRHRRRPEGQARYPLAFVRPRRVRLPIDYVRPCEEGPIDIPEVMNRLAFNWMGYVAPVSDSATWCRHVRDTERLLERLLATLPARDLAEVALKLRRVVFAIDTGSFDMARHRPIVEAAADDLEALARVFVRERRRPPRALWRLGEVCDCLLQGCCAAPESRAAE